jgi:hypothetical protein
MSCVHKEFKFMRRTWSEGVRKQGAEENVWTEDG